MIPNFLKRLLPMKFLATSAFSLLLLLYSAFSMAIDPVYTGGKGDAAIKGYDTVAYFTVGKAVKGKEFISYEHGGATWWFSSEENKQKFILDPEKYMPQYGGYCSYAVSRKTSASIKPDVFNIHEGKLYLNYNKSVQRRWLKDLDRGIKKADNHWSTVVND